MCSILTMVIFLQIIIYIDYKYSVSSGFFWWQKLLCGFPDQCTLLEKFRNNLKAFQEVRWSNVWEESVLPIFSSDNWMTLLIVEMEKQALSDLYK